MKSTQQYIDFDIPSWAAGLAGETGNEIPALLQRSQSSQSETEQKCQKLTFACATHSPRYFFKRRFYIFQLLISFKPSFYLSQKILVVIICDRLRFTFPWTRLDQSGAEWTRVDQSGQPQFNCDMSTATGATHIGGGLPQQYISLDLKDSAFSPS